ncbi:MAG: sporulation protein YqfD, partial [Ruminococcus sp.]
MIVKIIRFLRGYVSVLASGKFTERLINILNKNGFLYWDILPSDGGLTLCMPAKEYKRLRSYLADTRIRTKVQKRYGLPFFIRRYKGRVGLLIGAVIFVVLLSVFSRFIWTVNVIGNKEIPSTKILSVLKENGVYSGAYTNGIDVKATGRKVVE